MTALEKYNHCFINTFGVTEKELNKSFTFKDVAEWDSVAHLSLITELEDEFDVLFDSDDILHFGSYENGKEILRRMGITI